MPLLQPAGNYSQVRVNAGAPPVFRPGSNTSLQQKLGVVNRASFGPPIYRPGANTVANKALQPKSFSMNAPNGFGPPPVYRPAALPMQPKTVQPKMVQPKMIATVRPGKFAPSAPLFAAVPERVNEFETGSVRV